jgi:acetyl esterase/lipase
MTPGRLAHASLLVAIAGLVGFAPAQDEKPATPATPAAVEASPRSFEIDKRADIAYRTDKDADPERHKLDVYAPKGQKDFPVLFFVHGGTWRSGSKNLYVAIGNAFAQTGIGVVIPSYRLSPKVQHPAHAEDVAKAFAWTHENVARYGGNPDRIFAMGHSAGGHLVSLIATDPIYLKAEKLTPDAVRGVVAISGVYRIYHDVPLFNPIFGKDEEVCRKASPINHISGNHPPFLIAYGDKDFDHLDQMAIDLNAALEKSHSPTTLMKLANRNHYTIITSVIDETDPLNKAVRGFVGRYGK